MVWKGNSVIVRNSTYDVQIDIKRINIAKFRTKSHLNSK